jgi:predicted ATPase
MLRCCRIRRLTQQFVRPSAAYARYVETGILEPNQFQSTAITSADRLHAELSRVLAGFDATSSQARIAANPALPAPLPTGDANPHEIGELDSAEKNDDDRAGTLGDIIPSVFVNWRRMKRRDLLPPPKKHLGLVPKQLILKELQKQEEREMGIVAPPHPLSDVLGLYIHGGVGCGKSAMMNILYDELPTAHKKRTHFRQFLEEARLISDQVFTTHKWESRDAEQIVNEVGVRLCSSAEVLMLDDVAVQTDDEAVLLRRIFAAMYKIGICCVFAAYEPPEKLHCSTFKARQLMEPFVGLVQRHCEILDMGDLVDYRVTGAMKKGIFVAGKTYGSDRAALAAFNEGFLQLTSARVPAPRVIRAYGRDVEVQRTVGGVCRVTLAELLEEVCPDDTYFDIFARSFNTVFVEGAHALDPSVDADRHRLRRLATLVQALHRNRTKLVMHGIAGPEQIVGGGAPLLASSIDGTCAQLTGPEAAANEVAVTPQHATALAEQQAFALVVQECQNTLAVMQDREYLRSPHIGEPVTLLDGAPNAVAVLERMNALLAQEAAAGIDVEAEPEGSNLTRPDMKRPLRLS